MAGSVPSLRSIFPSRPHTCHTFLMFWRTVGQSSSNRSSSLPRYLSTLAHINKFRLVLPCESERRLRALVYNSHIRPLTLHLGVLITVRRTLLLDDPPRWHVNSAQVTAAQRFLPLLNHLYLGPEMSVHEVLAKASCNMSYCRTTWHRTPHLLKHPGEGHHICGRTSP